MKKNKLTIYLVVVLLFSGFIPSDNDFYYEINKGIELFGRVYREVAVNYVDQLNPKEFVTAGIDGMLGSLDPYSNFFDASDQKDLDIITKGKYGGIGASIGLRGDDITVLDLIEGFSAHRQGLRIGDVIKKINNIELSKDNYYLLGNYLKGDVGSSLSLTILRNQNEEILFNLIREEIEVKNISFYDFVPANSNNAYIKLSGFSHSAGDEVKKALLDLKSKKEINSLVLDLRGNPGGLLDAAIDVCEKFLAKGQLVVSVVGRDTTMSKKYYSKEEPILPKEKIVVLIDEHTASAAEIVAGALQDHDRAIILGTNSFGKGLVQTIITLPYGTSLKLTTAKYYTPSGRCIQKVDYSNNNRVFTASKIESKNDFHTDNNRKVFGSGGIMPDTIISGESKSSLIQKLIAEGVFFNFATKYSNNNQKIDVDLINENELAKDFSNFLVSSNYNYTSKSQKIISQLKESLKDEKKTNSKLNDLLDAITKQTEIDLAAELQLNKKEITNNIKEELSARLKSRVGRITESLKYDQQFESAFEIIKNEKVATSLLDSKVKLN